MGRSFYSRYSSCSPCYNPCTPYACAPLCGPCFPPPCFPCGPCAPITDCCKSYESCDTKSTYVIANSINTIDLSGSTTTPYTIPFQEQQDCLCEFFNDTTFIPKCNGNYKFNISVTVTADVSSTEYLNLVVNGVTKASAAVVINPSGSQTVSLTSTLCITKGSIVIVQLSAAPLTAFAQGVTITNRSLTINKSNCCSPCGSSSSCCSSKSSCGCKKCC
jgi:hypothetical protein